MWDLTRLIKKQCHFVKNMFKFGISPNKVPMFLSCFAKVFSAAQKFKIPFCSLSCTSHLD